MIGKAGQRIKQVRLDSGADVELSDNVGGTSDRIITITGTLQQIQAAQYMMQMAYDPVALRSCRSCSSDLTRYGVLALVSCHKGCGIPFLGSLVVGEERLWSSW